MAPAAPIPRTRHPTLLPIAAIACMACAVLEPPDEREAAADLVFRDIAVEHYRGSRELARAELDELRYRRDLARADGDRLRLVPIREGRPDGRVEAGHADAHLSSGIVALTRSVEHRSAAGERARTESATLDLRARTATGSSPVTLAGSGFTVTGQRFRYHWGGDERLVLEGGVKAVADASPVAAPAPKKQPRATRRSTP